MVSRLAKAEPTAMPASPITTEERTCPIPHRVVIAAVLDRDQLRALAMATKGR
jgi:hypothetical protein